LGNASTGGLGLAIRLCRRLQMVRRMFLEIERSGSPETSQASPGMMPPSNSTSY